MKKLITALLAIILTVSCSGTYIALSLVFLDTNNVEIPMNETYLPIEAAGQTIQVRPLTTHQATLYCITLDSNGNTQQCQYARFTSDTATDQETIQLEVDPNTTESPRTFYVTAQNKGGKTITIECRQPQIREK